jgi:hypothetical protein
MTIGIANWLTAHSLESFMILGRSKMVHSTAQKLKHGVDGEQRPATMVYTPITWAWTRNQSHMASREYSQPQQVPTIDQYWETAEKIG